MSATSYELGPRNYGPVSVSVSRDRIFVSLHGEIAIVASAFTGVVRLSPASMNLQNKNLFNRFFSIVKAERYSVELTNGRLFLIDSRKKSKRRIDSSGVNIMIPTKSVWRMTAAAGMQTSSWVIANWIDRYDVAEAARQQAATAAESNASEQNASEQRGEIPF